jgi:hypothetical protein
MRLPAQSVAFNSFSCFSYIQRFDLSSFLATFHISLLIFAYLCCSTYPFQLLLTLSFSYQTSSNCFSYLKQLLLPFLWVILIPRFCCFSCISHLFSHISQLLLASLSFTSCTSFIAFCTFLSWFYRLFSLFLAPLSVASRIFSFDHHIRSYASHISRCCFSHLYIDYCISLMLFWHLFHMLISLQSVNFNSLISFSYFQYLILPPLLVTSHISFCRFLHISQLLLIHFSVAFRVFVSCFSYLFLLLLTP